MVSAQLGLEPGTLGYCYLVPYQNKKTGQLEIQFQLGYKGILELVRRSGQVENIEARVVYEKDKFDFEYGLTPKLVHKPALKAQEWATERGIFLGGGLTGARGI